jgi:preprotein translocase subunit SecE
VVETAGRPAGDGGGNGKREDDGMKKLYLRAKEFFAEVGAELKKVSFPTRAETVGSTSVVLIFVVVVAIFLSGMDAVLVKLVAVLLQ